MHSIATFIPRRVAFHDCFGIVIDIPQRGLMPRHRLTCAVAAPRYEDAGRENH